MENQTILERIAPAHLLTFLGEKGLTSSEADHRANLIKEGHVPLLARWNSTGAINKTVKFQAEDVVLSEFRKIDLIRDSMIEGELNALSAWLREGIKAKDNILQFVMEASLDSFILETDEAIDFTKPTHPIQKSVQHENVTEENILGEFTIAERAEYYALQSMAASIGKRIHDRGEIANMRKELAVFKSKSFMEMRDGDGMRNFVVTNTPVYEAQELEDAFMKLQETHRIHESRLNFLKTRLKDTANSRNQEAAQKYREALTISQEVYRNEYNAYQDALREIRQKQILEQATLDKRRLALTQYVSKLRIVIPNSLQPILDTIIVPKETK